MQRRQSVLVMAVQCVLMFCVLVLCCASFAAAQVNTATLSGTVLDPQGLAVKNAKVTDRKSVV